MVFRESAVAGALVVEVEPVTDGRGIFARTFDAAVFRDLGFDTEALQCSTSFNRRAGTLRGLHYQAPPHGECKLIRCTAGAVCDVLLDLRVESATYGRWDAIELSSDNREAVFLPRGVAHGFQTLVDDSELLYMIDRPYEPAAARGVRWDDPNFTIEWPDAPGGRTMSDRDRGFPDYLRA